MNLESKFCSVSKMASWCCTRADLKTLMSPETWSDKSTNTAGERDIGRLRFTRTRSTVDAKTWSFADNMESGSVDHLFDVLPKKQLVKKSDKPRQNRTVGSSISSKASSDKPNDVSYSLSCPHPTPAHQQKHDCSRFHGNQHRKSPGFGPVSFLFFVRFASQ